MRSGSDGKKFKDYEGGREVDAMLSAVEVLVQPPVTQVSTRAQVRLARWLAGSRALRAHRRRLTGPTRARSTRRPPRPPRSS